MDACYDGCDGDSLSEMNRHSCHEPSLEPCVNGVQGRSPAPHFVRKV